MSGKSQSLRMRAEEFIQELSEKTFSGAVAVRATALQARAMAVAVDSRLLEAAALMQLGRTYSPTIEPSSMLLLLQRAENIFMANGLQTQAACCRLASARALYDLGQERNAIAMADRSLAEVSLPGERRAGAYLIKALSHAELGEFDEAIRLLTWFAQPLAEPGAAALVTHVKCGIAIVYVRLFVIKNYPHLWKGHVESVEVKLDIPTLSFLLSLFHDSGKHIPPEANLNYLDVARQLALGLTGSFKASVVELQRIAAKSVDREPPMAAWSYYCAGLIQHHAVELPSALESFRQAKSLAEQWGLTQLLREIALQVSVVKELLGDFSGSLQAYKTFSDLRLSSMTVTAFATSSGMLQDASPAPVGPEGASRLRHLESRHVKKALRFIEANLSEAISVNDVVAQSGVSRRTLEISFKESKSCTVAQYVKRCKLEIAAGQLRTTNLSIQAIARSVGYEWPAAFSRDFVAQFGTTPSSWRRIDAIQNETLIAKRRA